MVLNRLKKPKTKNQKRKEKVPYFTVFLEVGCGDFECNSV